MQTVKERYLSICDDRGENDNSSSSTRTRTSEHRKSLSDAISRLSYREGLGKQGRVRS